MTHSLVNPISPWTFLLKSGLKLMREKTKKKKKSIGKNLELRGHMKMDDPDSQCTGPSLFSFKKTSPQNSTSYFCFHPTYFHGKIPKERCKEKEFLLRHVNVRQAQEENWTAKIKQKQTAQILFHCLFILTKSRHYFLNKKENHCCFHLEHQLLKTIMKTK